MATAAFALCVIVLSVTRGCIVTIDLIVSPKKLEHVPTGGQIAVA